LTAGLCAALATVGFGSWFMLDREPATAMRKFQIAVEQADVFSAPIFGGGLGAVSAELHQLGDDFQGRAISAEVFLRTLREITADVPVAAQTVLRKLGEEAAARDGLPGRCPRG